MDVLSDIATSFSTFTNLPAMRPERLDVAAVLRHCADLFRQHDGDEHGELCLTLPPRRHLHRVCRRKPAGTHLQQPAAERQAGRAPGRPPRQAVALRGRGPRHRCSSPSPTTARASPTTCATRCSCPTSPPRPSGSGIGLAVAKRGIESAGGRIWFETVVGEGTVFHRAAAGGLGRRRGVGAKKNIFGGPAGWPGQGPAAGAPGPLSLSLFSLSDVQPPYRRRPPRRPGPGPRPAQAGPRTCSNPTCTRSRPASARTW
ncbi:MAG: hypothetical protein WKG07_29275 [Hymenobacter sp.]